MSYFQLLQFFPYKEIIKKGFKDLPLILYFCLQNYFMWRSFKTYKPRTTNQMENIFWSTKIKTKQSKRVKIKNKSVSCETHPKRSYLHVGRRPWNAGLLLTLRSDRAPWICIPKDLGRLQICCFCFPVKK